MKKAIIGAFASIGMLAGAAAVAPAQAADLGGDCCADLEERIAELEATTVRKGNRKVSLTLTGFVAQQVLFWDDGEESNVYITDTGSVTIGTNFTLLGEAQINSDWSAGFAIRVELNNNDSLLVDQGAPGTVLGALNLSSGDDTNAAQCAVSTGLNDNVGQLCIERAYWFVKSKTYGQVSVGTQSSAADNAAVLVDGSGSLVQANYVLYDVNGFTTRSNGALNGFVWGHLANCAALDGQGGAFGDCDGIPYNAVKYDSPTFGGFSFSASWGEDDVWAIAARYAGQLGDFKVSVAAAYHESSDETQLVNIRRDGIGLDIGATARANGGLDVGFFQVGAFVMHTPTGLFLYGAYATENNDTTAVAGGGQNSLEGEHYYIKGGINTKINPLGNTVFYAEYNNKQDSLLSLLQAAGATGSEYELFGIGVVQNIDAAAMSMWLSYRHYDAEVDGLGAGGTTLDVDDFDLVKFGALIAF